MNKKLKTFVLNITKEIGKVQMKYFNSFKNLKIENKSQYFSDIFTNVDKIAEKLSIKKSKEFGFEGTILIEETGEIKLGNSKQRLIIDPLDGTFFYSKNIKNFCVAIALEENGQIIFATVYNPSTNEFFYAEKGKGAFLNNKKIEVSKNRELEKSTIILGAYPNHQLEKLQKIFLNLMTSGGLRLLAHLINLNLCYIAAGRYEGIIGFYSILPEWDKLPGFFILEEAKGKVTDFSNKKWDNNIVKFIASNNLLHNELLKIVS